MALALVPRVRCQWVVPFDAESLAGRVCDESGNGAPCIDTIAGDEFSACASQPANGKQLEVFLEQSTLGHNNPVSYTHLTLPTKA